jgi:hypothetical protein
MLNEGLLAGLKIGGATTIAMVVVEQVPIEKVRVSLAVAVSCCVFICGLTWWLSSRFTKIDARLEGLERRLKEPPCDTKKGKDND